MRSAPLRLLAVAAATLAAAPAFAGPRHHPPRAGPSTSDDAGDPRAYGGNWEGEAIARATARMQNAPGVTNELAPDAKATATGGPSGGVPGFSGH